ncbi:hypothetical protein [Maridesulfovibrio hydrothermalis]|uniref:N-acetyltransferase domain-containing protein n=1 Tax=Maridesulfovibrio hydrothermalis AM13 = DSM 14728 TaxID=1121451 RepID=L0RFW6_9BACT|nr:hypothetical protein [Maridesulfovibrio hydrothermalis]CCO25100.1 conserved protein of unknown function [Maridesulfovibrio hydrothermalis AM13 = DSM 14728]
MSRAKYATKLTLGIPSIEDIESVAVNIRESDRIDMEGLHPGKPAEDIIMEDVQHSRVVYGLYLDGVIHGVFGVMPAGRRGTGIPWVVGTGEVDKIPLLFARASRSFLNMLQKSFPVLDTLVCSRNKKSVFWHRWCGFKFKNEKVKIGRDYYYRAVRRSGIISIEKESR